MTADDLELFISRIDRVLADLRIARAIRLRMFDALRLGVEMP